MAGQLQGRVALVTGGSSGIGRATSLIFVREGAKVVVADVSIKGGEETVRMISKAGGEAVFVKTDVTSEVEVEAMVKTAVETYGRLDCAFNNAGIASPYTLTECATKEWDRVMNINLKGVFLCMKYEVIHMIKQGGGAIVNTSSAAGLDGMGYCLAYVASKHGVSGMTKDAAIEYAKAGIRINAVCPGGIRTPITETLDGGTSAKEQAEYFDRIVPLGRIGEPREVAEAVVWLCSDAASYVTGHLMSVDGGYLAHSWPVLAKTPPKSL